MAREDYGQLSNEIGNFELYATTGRGTEKFAEEEIKERLNYSNVTINVQKRDGKVFFTVPYSCINKENICALKSVERIFVLIVDYSNKDFIKDKRTFLNKLFQEFSISTNFINAKKLIEDSSLSNKFNADHNLNDQHTECAKPSHVIPMKKHKLNDSHNADINLNASTLLDSHISAKLKSKFCSNSIKQDSDDNIEKRISVDVNIENKTQQTKNVKKSFRVSVRCSGKVKRWLDFKKLSKDIAWRICKITGNWEVDLHHPDFEVCVHISDEYLTAGIPLTKLPLSKRDYISDFGLRTTIAWIMSNLAKIKTGDIVLDPMCGKATVLIEANSEFKASIYIGSDIDLKQLLSANQNVQSGSNGLSETSFVLADVLNLPYRDGCVDVILCDAPFNQNHKIYQVSTQWFYIQFLRKFHRILAPGGRCVLLVRHDMAEFIITKLSSSQSPPPTLSLSHDSQPLTLLASHYVKLGETHADIIVLKKDVH